MTNMAGFRELEYRRQIDLLAQPDLVTVLCATVSAIDDEHLTETLKQISDDDLGTLAAMSIMEQRARETAQGFYGFEEAAAVVVDGTENRDLGDENPGDAK